MNAAVLAYGPSSTTPRIIAQHNKEFIIIKNIVFDPTDPAKIIYGGDVQTQGQNNQPIPFRVFVVEAQGPTIIQNMEYASPSPGRSTFLAQLRFDAAGKVIASFVDEFKMFFLAEEKGAQTNPREFLNVTGNGATIPVDKRYAPYDEFIDSIMIYNQRNSVDIISRKTNGAFATPYFIYTLLALAREDSPPGNSGNNSEVRKCVTGVPVCGLGGTGKTCTDDWECEVEKKCNTIFQKCDIFGWGNPCTSDSECQVSKRCEISGTSCTHSGFGMDCMYHSDCGGPMKRCC